MSDLVPMYSIDKVKVVACVPIEDVLKVRKRAKKAGVSISQYVATYLGTLTANDALTSDDEMEAQRIREENKIKRKNLIMKRKAKMAARIVNN